MGRFYGLRIRSGIMTLEEVPSYWRAKTEKWLEDNLEEQGVRRERYCGDDKKILGPRSDDRDYRRIGLAYTESAKMEAGAGPC